MKTTDELKEDLDYEFCVEYEYYHKESTYDTVEVL